MLCGRNGLIIYGGGFNDASRRSFLIPAARFLIRSGTYVRTEGCSPAVNRMKGESMPPPLY